MKQANLIVLFLLIFFLPSSLSFARWVWSPQEGKFVNSETPSENTVESLYEDALKSYEDKNFKEAGEKFRDIVKHNPNNRVAPDAQYRLGTLYEEQGDLSKAFDAYKNLITSYPHNRYFEEVVERIFRIGSAYREGKKAKVLGMAIVPSRSKAIMVFKFITEQAPFSQFGDKAAFELGMAYKEAGQFQDAVKAFQNMIDQYPKSALAEDARFQMADTAFKRSSVENRDQKALDDASEEIGKFLSKYPDTEASEKAGKLKQAVDEANAEKNYRIALYYEKDNYIQSALIYYADAAERYPDTKWGIKARERLEALKEPAAYIKGKQDQIQEELKILEKKLNLLTPEEKSQADAIQRKMELLKQREKDLSREESQSIEHLNEDIQRREAELKVKLKNLEKKKKEFSDHPSDDLKSVIERWESSLQGEKDQIEKEKTQLQAWREELGVKDRKWGLPFMPSKESEVEKIRKMNARKLMKLSEERKSVLDEKELLYKHRSEVMTQIEKTRTDIKTGADDEWMKDLDLQDEAVRGQKDKLNVIETEMRALEKAIEEKQAEYGRAFEKTSRFEKMVKAPVQALDKSFHLLNPFSGGKDDLEEKSLQELLEMEMHLKEKITSQQNILDTLGASLNEEAVIRERQRLGEEFEVREAEAEDPMKLRKEGKQIQKKIRALYQEIQDLDRQKDEALKQMKQVAREQQAKSNVLVKGGRTVLNPIRRVGRGFKAFFVGLPNADVETTQTAEAMSDKAEMKPEALSIQQDIEIKSLLIEAKSREIAQYKKELEVLGAKASMDGGLKFRSVLIDVPYSFIGEAIENARKIVPKKEREQVMLERLEKEKSVLESLQTEWETIKKLIQEKETSGVLPSAATVESPRTAEYSEGTSAEALHKELEKLQTDLHAQKTLFQQEKAQLKVLSESRNQKEKAAERGKKEADKTHSRLEEELKNLHKELKAIEQDLQSAIQAETRLESEETSILQKRLAALEEVMPKVNSKAVSEDLLREKSQMEARLGQLASRKDFLAEELKRFQTKETGMPTS